MTESLDLDALEAVARAATPGPWEFCDAHVIPRVECGSADIAEEVANLDNAVHISVFDPSTVLALIGRVREAEAELLEAHAHFAVQEGRLREAVTRAESAEATIARVRELHKPINRGAGGLKCSLCTTEDGFLELFPCFTIRALGGDQS